MNSVVQDVRYAFRVLAKSPGFTLVSLLRLAIGIGANTAIFSFVDAALLKPLPYVDADRIVRVMEKSPGLPETRHLYPDFSRLASGQYCVRLHGCPDRRRGHANRRWRTGSVARRPRIGALFRHFRHEGRPRPHLRAR